MGRFQQTIDDALAARKQQEEAKKRAEEDAKRAILPFYNKVMPILNEAKSDLDRAATEEPRIEINYPMLISDVIRIQNLFSFNLDRIPGLLPLFTGSLLIPKRGFSGQIGTRRKDVESKP